MKNKQSYILNRSITTLLIAVMLLFITAVFGTMKNYAAEGNIIGDNYRGMDWKLIEKADGTYELKLGKEGEKQTLDRTGIISLGDTPGWAEMSVSTKNVIYLGYHNEWPWLKDGRDQSISSVKFLGEVLGKGNLAGMFAGMSEITSLDLRLLDVSSATHLPTYNWGTLNDDGSPNDYPCDKLKTLDLTGWNTENVVAMNELFLNCAALTEIKGIEGFKTGNVKRMQRMFEGCSRLTSINLSSFDTSNVEYMHNMFSGCGRLTEIKGLDKWNTSKVTRMNYMFGSCSRLTGLNLSSFDTSAVWDMASMFRSCPNLETVEGLDKFDTGAVENMDKMFVHSPKLSTRALLDFDLSSLTNANDMLTNANGIADGIRSQKTSNPNDPQNDLLEAAAQAAEAGVAGQTGDEALATVHSISAVGKVINVIDTEAEAKAAKDALEAAKAENPQNPDKIKAAQENYDAKAKAAEDAVKAAEEAVAKAIASAEKTGNDTIKGNAKALEDKLASIKAAYDARKANDAADAAIGTAKGALKDAKDAKTAADGVAASSPGSDAAVKAAEEATAKAEAAVKAADDAVKAAEATGDQSKIDAAKALKADADKALADATKLEAEQKIKRAENNPSEGNKKAAQDAANKALDAAKKAYGENSAEAQAAQQLVNNANALPTTASKIGQEITVSKNVYVITKDPGATWDGEVTLKTAKNAKNVSVPKVVKHEGSSYEVNRVKAGAFRAKKIRKVTLGANIEKLDKNAFKKSKATTIVVKTKSLTKARVKGALKGSKVKTVQVKVGSKKVNKKYVKKYKKIFTKKNAGKKVTVK